MEMMRKREQKTIQKEGPKVLKRQTPTYKIQPARRVTLEERECLKLILKYAPKIIMRFTCKNNYKRFIICVESFNNAFPMDMQKSLFILLNYRPKNKEPFYPIEDLSDAEITQKLKKKFVDIEDLPSQDDPDSTLLSKELKAFKSKVITRSKPADKKVLEKDIVF